MDPDVIIVTSYETAIRAGYNFLSVFLKKCTMKGEDDYRPLFENFVHDLLSTVNKPEWPSSELLLSILGRILVSEDCCYHNAPASRLGQLVACQA